MENNEHPGSIKYRLLDTAQQKLSVLKVAGITIWPGDTTTQNGGFLELEAYYEIVHLEKVVTKLRQELEIRGITC